MKIARLCMMSLMAVAVVAAQAATITTVAGNGMKGFAGDGDAATSATLNGPDGIVLGPDGALYICDTANQRIRRVKTDGTIETIAGNGEAGWSGDGGPATGAKLHEPYEVRLDKNGNVYWVERLSHTVRKLDKNTGVITTIAGIGTRGFSGDGGPGPAAQLNDPHSIGFDKNWDLYIADVRNHRIRKIDMQSGMISTFSGTGERQPTPDGAAAATAPLNGPRALDFDGDGNLWLALREGNAVYKFDMGRGTVHHVAGTGAKGYTGDGGPAKESTLNGPKGIAVGPQGDVYIVDTENHVIRAVDQKSGLIRTIAGDGTPGDGPEGDPAKCKLRRPHGVCVGPDGAIYIGDTETHRVRKISE